MPNLTASQESFIEMMVSEDDLARRGFELLLKRHDFDRFFDALKAAGLFDPSRNPAPIPTEKPGYFRIPYWAALNYLVAVARLSGERDDLELAEKVMTIIRTVSIWREPDGSQRENYVTAWKFAEIFGLVPTVAVTFDDLKFIPEWLNTKFEKILVGRSLDEGAMTRFLASPSGEDWEKAVIVLRHCTHIEWEGPDKEERTPRMAVDSFWVKKMIRHQSPTLGEKAGQKASEVFVERVREIFGAGTRSHYSETYRPAIEDDSQNRDWHEIENCSIEGLRDVLMGWCDANPVAVKPFAEKLLVDQLEILRRVGIYVLGRQWPSWRDLYVKIVGEELFTSRLLHELYEFLKERFRDMNDTEKAATIEAIRRITPPQGGSDPALSLKRIQHLWLSAISGNDYAPADKWFSELEKESNVGPIAKHPSFGSYIESGWVGPGASQYSVTELLAFATARDIVEKLNAFEERDPWRGPTVEGLATALGQAVRAAPAPFLESLPDFIEAKWRFQHSLITGLQQSWESTNSEQKTDWDRGWQSVLGFFQQLIGNPEFWHENSTETARCDWIASAIADCLDAGTKRDDHAYPPELLPRAEEILRLLLDCARPTEEPSNDPMTRAINTP